MSYLGPNPYPLNIPPGANIPVTALDAATQTKVNNALQVPNNLSDVASKPSSASNIGAVQKAGDVMTGSLTLKAANIQYQSATGVVLGNLSQDASGPNGGWFGVINAASNNWNLHWAAGDTTNTAVFTGPINVSGGASFGARPTWVGYTPWDNSNLANPVVGKGHQAFDTAGTYLQSGSPPSIANIASSGAGPDAAQLTISNAGNNAASAVIQFHREGAWAAYFGLDTDNVWKVGGRSMGSVANTIWHAGNFAGPAVCAQNSGFNNFGVVSTVNGGLPSPWVVGGLSGPANATANAISILGVQLRNYT